MKIKTQEKSWDEVRHIPPISHMTPARPSRLLALAARIAGKSDLSDTNFTYTCDEGDAAGKPALILMNHSAFIDLEIAETIFKKRPFNIVCTSDGFVGKARFMRRVGCIPTQKFVSTSH